MAAGHHAARFHSGAGSRLRHRLRAVAGAASLARTTEIVRKIEKIALDTPGIVRVAAFAGLSGATRTQASNAAALFPVFEEPRCG